ncbi:MAG TPA: MauE/DoxX family redox-associated membrane protein [Pyrinomonadaceae bacterium]|nr:MauE/DoxX family redox-associated membrane protein [Pyrinomonadaceae bacterium]
MHLITVLLRLGLSAVFGVAAITKLTDQRGTREALKNFGSPRSLAPTLSILLPIAELAIASGLLFTTTTSLSALAALFVLALFVVAIGVNLARGNTHDCHCFGQLYSRPLGWSTLVRNLIFAAFASFILWQSHTETPASIPDILAHLSQAECFIGGVALLIAGAAVIYARQRQKLLPVETPATPQGLPLDTVAPPFELDAYEGGTRSLDQLLGHGKPLLLVFTNPNCGPCVTMFSEIKDWQQAHREHLTIALISFGTIKENFVNVARNGLGDVLLEKRREVAKTYGAMLTPTAVMVNTKGRIASPVAAGADEIRKLLSTIVVSY